MFKTINTPKLPIQTEAVLMKLSSSLYINLENIITKNIYPADKQNLKVDDDKSSALGAMGLKPKIVH